MKLADPALFKFLGWNTQGDLGPFTFYTSKRKDLVFFLRAPPTKPATPRQRYQRDLWTAAALAWSVLTQQQKDDWERVSQRAHLRITGINLFMYWALMNDDPCIRTLEHQTGITLLAPIP